MTYPLIKVFNPSDTVFTSNGNKVLQPISCKETKSADEWYIETELSLDYVPFIEQDAIIVVPTKYGNQPFRVHNLLIGSSIEFRANHIGFDSKNYIIDTLTVTGTASAILTALCGSTPFTVYSDISGSKTLTFERISLYEALIDLQEAFGGFLDFDGWQIRLTATLGADRGVVVEYGKNLEEAEVSEDWGGVCTELFPIGRDGLMLTPKTLTSATQYDKPYAKIVDFDTDDLTVLNNLALAYLSRFDLPKVNYKVKSTIQDVYLNDTIKVVARQYSLLANVLAYTTNSLTGLNESVEFGNYRRTVRGAFSAIRDTMEEISQRVIAVGNITQQQTELINAAGNYGYKTITDNEIYFHDTIPLSSAVNIMRMNVAGIGFSTTGISGPFITAWTIDSKFNADFIKAGTLDADRIRGDLIDISANTSVTSRVTASYVDGKIAEINAAKPNRVSNLATSFEQGTLTSGVPGVSTYHIRTKAFYPIAGGYVTVQCNDIYEAMVVIYSPTYTYVSSQAWSSLLTFSLTDSQFFKVVLRSKAGNTIVPDNIVTSELKVANEATASMWNMYYGDLSLEAQKEMYQFRILSRSGLTFDGDTSLILDAQVLLDNIDVTSVMAPAQFVWTRFSKNATLDAQFNALGVNGSTLTVSSTYLDRSATYQCLFSISDVAYLNTFTGNRILTLSSSSYLLAIQSGV